MKPVKKLKLPEMKDDKIKRLSQLQGKAGKDSKGNIYVVSWDGSIRKTEHKVINEKGKTLDGSNA